MTAAHEPLKLNRQQALDVLQVFVWYSYNYDLLDMVRDVYGEGRAESYYKEKLAVINNRGMLYWAGELDHEHRMNLMQSMARRYGELLEVEDQ